MALQICAVHEYITMPMTSHLQNVTNENRFTQLLRCQNLVMSHELTWCSDA